MKTLHLIRHAKSSWEEPGLSDRERPLNPRGKRACITMASALSKLEQQGWRENIISSDARRAQDTASGISQALLEQRQGPLQWQVQEAIYTFDESCLLRWLKSQGEEQQQLTLIGHNPAFTYLINQLCDIALKNLPTCGYAQLLLNIDSWEALGPGCGELSELITPKGFKAKQAGH
ncbi:MAG: histidine phosphatase family protein [Cellvibrionaceae bacterium]|nr:histidine phosphatase family protein [Cellvibrionaceae bacterium]